MVFRIVKNSEEAKDLAQEAFVKAYQNRASFRAESGFYTWIYRIAINLALNYVTRNRDRGAESIENVEPGAFSSPPDNRLENRELGQAIEKAVEGLPPRQKTVFILRQYEDKSFNEIASILSITEGAVKANYHQAVRKLQATLSPYIAEGRLSA